MKRRISDLLDDFRDDTVELEHSASLSSERIKELTMNKIENKKKPKRIVFRVLVAAAIIAALGMSVFAAEEIMAREDWFLDYFSGKDVTADISANQLALLEVGLMEVNQSVTDAGYTVTLESAISDRYTARMKFRVEAPEGEVLDGLYSFGELPMHMFGRTINPGHTTGSKAGWRQLEDGDAADNSVSLLLELTLSDPEDRDVSFVDGTEWTIELNTFKDCTDPEKASTVIAQGQWSFTFAFADSDAMINEVEMLSEPVSCTGRRSLGQKRFDVTVKVTSFRLRPLTATLFYEEPLTGYWEGIRLDSIYVVMKDGRKIEADYSMGYNNDNGWEEQFDFLEPVALADVDYVEFPGGDRAYMPDTAE